MGLTVENFTVGCQSMDSRRPTARLACTPALSVASTMEASREGFRLAGSRASGAGFMGREGCLKAVSIAAEVFMAAEVTDNLSQCNNRQVIRVITTDKL